MSNKRGSELRQIGIGYTQFALENNAANRNEKAWLDYIRRDYGAIHQAVGRSRAGGNPTGACAVDGDSAARGARRPAIAAGLHIS